MSQPRSPEYLGSPNGQGGFKFKILLLQLMAVNMIPSNQAANLRPLNMNSMQYQSNNYPRMSQVQSNFLSQQGPSMSQQSRSFSQQQTGAYHQSSSYNQQQQQHSRSFNYQQSSVLQQASFANNQQPHALQQTNFPIQKPANEWQNPIAMNNQDPSSTNNLQKRELPQSDVVYNLPADAWQSSNVNTDKANTNLTSKKSKSRKKNGSTPVDLNESDSSVVLEKPVNPEDDDDSKESDEKNESKESSENDAKEVNKKIEEIKESNESDESGEANEKTSIDATNGAKEMNRRIEEIKETKESNESDESGEANEKTSTNATNDVKQVTGKMESKETKESNASGVANEETSTDTIQSKTESDTSDESTDETTTDSTLDDDSDEDVANNVKQKFGVPKESILGVNKIGKLGLKIETHKTLGLNSNSLSSDYQIGKTPIARKFPGEVHTGKQESYNPGDLTRSLGDPLGISAFPEGSKLDQRTAGSKHFPQPNNLPEHFLLETPQDNKITLVRKLAHYNEGPMAINADEFSQNPKESPLFFIQLAPEPMVTTSLTSQKSIGQIPGKISQAGNQESNNLGDLSRSLGSPQFAVMQQKIGTPKETVLRLKNIGKLGLTIETDKILGLSSNTLSPDYQINKTRFTFLKQFPVKASQTEKQVGINNPGGFSRSLQGIHDIIGVPESSILDQHRIGSKIVSQQNNISTHFLPGTPSDNEVILVRKFAKYNEGPMTVNAEGISQSPIESSLFFKQHAHELEPTVTKSFTSNTSIFTVPIQTNPINDAQVQLTTGSGKNPQTLQNVKPATVNNVTVLKFLTYDNGMDNLQLPRSDHFNIVDPNLAAPADVTINSFGSTNLQGTRKFGIGSLAPDVTSLKAAPRTILDQNDMEPIVHEMSSVMRTSKSNILTNNALKSRVFGQNKVNLNSIKSVARTFVTIDRGESTPFNGVTGLSSAKSVLGSEEATLMKPKSIRMLSHLIGETPLQIIWVTRSNNSVPTTIYNTKSPAIPDITIRTFLFGFTEVKIHMEIGRGPPESDATPPETVPISARTIVSEIDPTAIFNDMKTSITTPKKQKGMLAITSSNLAIGLNKVHLNKVRGIGRAYTTIHREKPSTWNKLTVVTFRKDTNKLHLKSITSIGRSEPVFHSDIFKGPSKIETTMYSVASNNFSTRDLQIGIPAPEISQLTSEPISARAIVGDQGDKNEIVHDLMVPIVKAGISSVPSVATEQIKAIGRKNLHINRLTEAGRASLTIYPGKTLPKPQVTIQTYRQGVTSMYLTRTIDTDTIVTALNWSKPISVSEVTIIHPIGSSKLDVQGDLGTVVHPHSPPLPEVISDRAVLQMEGQVNDQEITSLQKSGKMPAFKMADLHFDQNKEQNVRAAGFGRRPVSLYRGNPLPKPQLTVQTYGHGVPGVYLIRAIDIGRTLTTLNWGKPSAVSEVTMTINPIGSSQLDVPEHVGTLMLPHIEPTSDVISDRAILQTEGQNTAQEMARLTSLPKSGTMPDFKTANLHVDQNKDQIIRETDIIGRTSLTAHQGEPISRSGVTNLTWGKGVNTVDINRITGIDKTELTFNRDRIPPASSITPENLNGFSELAMYRDLDIDEIKPIYTKPGLITQRTIPDVVKVQIGQEVEPSDHVLKSSHYNAQNVAKILTIGTNNPALPEGRTSYKIGKLNGIVVRNIKVGVSRPFVEFYKKGRTYLDLNEAIMSMSVSTVLIDDIPDQDYSDPDFIDDLVETKRPNRELWSRGSSLDGIIDVSYFDLPVSEKNRSEMKENPSRRKKKRSTKSRKTEIGPRLENLSGERYTG